MISRIICSILCFGCIIFPAARSLSATDDGPDPRQEYEPSFPCEAARSVIEQLTCGDKHLAVLDRALAQALHDLLGNDSVAREGELAEQRTWLRQRLVTCNIRSRGEPPDGVAQSVACLERLYRRRIASLGAKRWRLVEKPRQRELTTDGIELVVPLIIGKRTLKGTVTAADIGGMLDEPAVNLQGLSLGPPGAIDDDSKWKAVHTCREWTQLHEQGWFAYDSANMGSDGIFLRACGVLAAINTGHAAKVSYLPQEAAGDIRLYSPLIMGAVDLDVEQRITSFAKEGRSLGDLESRADDPLAIFRGPRFYYKPELIEQPEAADLIISTMAVEKNELRYGYGDTTNVLYVLARGDFTGDGIEDLLVYHGYGAAFGTGGASELVVFTRLTDHSAIEPVRCALTYVPCQMQISR